VAVDERFPGGGPKPLGHGRRVDDVGKKDGAEDALRSFFDARKGAHAGDVVGDPWRVADEFRRSA